MDDGDSFTPLAWLGAIALVVLLVVTNVPIYQVFFRPQPVSLYDALALGLLGIVCTLIVWLNLLRKSMFRFFIFLNVGFGVNALYLTIMAYAVAYRSLGLADSSTPKVETHDPAICLYFSIITLTTVGYGDFRPAPAARFAAASEALLGFLVMAALIGAFARMFILLFEKMENKIAP
jgi:hypothetical protein